MTRPITEEELLVELHNASITPGVSKITYRSETCGKPVMTKSAQSTTMNTGIPTAIDSPPESIIYILTWQLTQGRIERLCYFNEHSASWMTPQRIFRVPMNFR